MLGGCQFKSALCGFFVHAHAGLVYLDELILCLCLLFRHINKLHAGSDAGSAYYRHCARERPAHAGQFSADSFQRIAERGQPNVAHLPELSVEGLQLRFGLDNVSLQFSVFCGALVHAGRVHACLRLFQNVELRLCLVDFLPEQVLFLPPQFH